MLPALYWIQNTALPAAEKWTLSRLKSGQITLRGATGAKCCKWHFVYWLWDVNNWKLLLFGTWDRTWTFTSQNRTLICFFSLCHHRLAFIYYRMCLRSILKNLGLTFLCAKSLLFQLVKSKQSKLWFLTLVPVSTYSLLLFEKDWA